MTEAGARKWIITITVILASMIELIDTSIVNVALPQMMGNLGATLDEIAWVVTAYVVANVIVDPDDGLVRRRPSAAETISPVRSSCSRRVVLLRTRDEHLGARDLPLHPGRRRRRAALDVAGDPGRDVPARGAGARQRPLRPRRRRRPDDRADARRLDHGQLFLALDLLRQPADRHRRDAADVLVHSRPEGRSGPSAAWTGPESLSSCVGIGSLQIVLERGERDDWFSATYITVLACRRDRSASSRSSFASSPRSIRSWTCAC